MSRPLASYSFLLAASLTSTLFAQEVKPVSQAASPQGSEVKKEVASTPASGGAAASASATPVDSSDPSTQGKSTASKSTASKSTEKKAREVGVPRDPYGIVGISPFWEAVNSGDAAYLARDLGSTLAHYQAAIIADPKNPLGHLRMAELSLKESRLAEAEEFLGNALRFVGENIRAKAQASFLMAELRERQGARDEAILSWRAYKSLVSQLPEVVPGAPIDPKAPLPPQIFVKTADQRASAIETAKKLELDYSSVKERIQKKLEEAEKAAKGK